MNLADAKQLEFRDKLLIKMREKNNFIFEMIRDDVALIIDGVVNAYKVMHSDWV